MRSVTADDLAGLLQSGIRFVLVAQKPIDLSRLGETNSIFVLELPEGIRTAMGSRRAAGRSLLKVYWFDWGGMQCTRVGEFEDDERLDRLDLPYHATAIAVVMPDGTERLFAGVVDEELASAYAKVLGSH